MMAEHYFETEYNSLSNVFETEFEEVVSTGDEIQKQEKSLYIDKNGTHEVYSDEGCVMTKFTAEVNVPERKEEQTKAISVTENGNYSVLPDEDKVLSGVDIEVDVTDNRVTEIETAIDESGVLDSTEGTATEKVGRLIDLAGFKEKVQNLINANTVQAAALQYLMLTEKQISELDFSQVLDFNSAFAGNPYIKNFIMDFSNAKALRFILYGCPNLETVVITGTKNVSNWNTAFGNCPKLKTVKTLDFSATNGLGNFDLSSPIETLLIVPETIKVSATFRSAFLSAESIQSIFDGLAPVTTAQTLTLPSTLKILQSQVDSANEKGWTVAGGTVVSEEEYYG